MAAAFVAAAISIAPCILAQTLPALPQTFLDTSYPSVAGKTIAVAAGGDLQNALDTALPGDTITVQAGATFTGPFTLPAKSGSGWIIVRTSASDGILPIPGKRITPAFAAQMPKIVTPNDGPAFQTAQSAHNYRLVGLEITTAAGVAANYGLVALGTDTETSLSLVPSYLILDRVYIHGQPGANMRRGVALNSASSAVIDSYISEVHEVGADAQAIAGWNGPGPFKIAGNYLEAAGENVLFGGSDPSINLLVPSDIEVRGNNCFKQLSWKSDDPSYAGIAWTVKNLFELKNAQRVLVDGNTFEQNWPAAQNGFSILFTVRNQGGTAPWSVVQDVTFTHNIVRHVAAAVNILGTDDIYPSQQTKRILVANNLFDDVNATNWGGSGRLFQILDGTADVTIDHNTAFQTGEVIAASGTANSGFTYRNNLSPNNQYGVAGDNFYGDPLGTLATYFLAVVFRRNVLQGGDPAKYPTDNFFPATMADVGFADLAGGNYLLQGSSPYKNAGTDGKDAGADIDALPVPFARSDFNRDSKSDILLSNTSTHDVALWLMNGTTIASGAVIGNPGSSYVVRTIGDYNGDGKADIALQNTSTGVIAIWLMNGATILSGAVIGTPGASWVAVASADINGDGTADIILRNSSTGDVAAWLMNAGAISAGAVIGSPGLSYNVVGAGDFNGDGKDDLLLQNAAGDIAEWQMNGLSIAAAAVVASPGTSWVARAGGDFNADGRADILLRNSANGGIAIWQMSSFTITAGAALGSPGTAYNVAGSADYNGDGKADVLLRDGSGNLAVWLLNGNAITGGAVVGSPGANYVPVTQ